MKLLTLIRGLWDYYVVGTWVTIFPPNNDPSENEDEQ